MTARNRPLFFERGHAYVYFCYGNHFMLNVSGQREGIGEGVLLRAAEPLEGIAQMERNRGTDRVQDLARGPGRLAEAFGVDGDWMGWIWLAMVFCGWVRQCGLWRESGLACGSVSARRLSGCCDFMSGGVSLSAGRNC